MESYKREHEQFVSGHNGTTPIEVAVMTLTPCANILLRDLLLLLYGLHSMSFWPRIAFDFSIIIVPAVLTNTVLSHLTTTVGISMLSVAVAFCLVAIHQTGTASLRRNFTVVTALEMEPQRPFLNNTRSLMNISTAIVILGVDFTVFPRRFAKSETFGTGYMDIGVGCFVVSNALVCPEARGKISTCQSVKEFVKRVAKSLQSSLPLLVFGIGRLLAVKATDYHEHVSEYGVHWNFFITLAVVKVVSCAVLCVCPVRLSCAMAVVIISVYQFALSRMGLSDYIINGADGTGSRRSFLEANREGILSCMGYIAIYLAGVQIGSLLFKIKKQTFWDWCKTLMLLLFISASGYVCFLLSSVLLQPTSRRMANLTFVFWMINMFAQMGLSVQVLCSCLAVDLISTAITALVSVNHKKADVPKTERQLLAHPRLKSAVPCLLHAVNANGLFYFLLSNVLTGIINLSIYTHHASAVVAVVILLIYTFFLSVIIVYMDKNKITTKVW